MKLKIFSTAFFFLFFTISAFSQQKFVAHLSSFQAVPPSNSAGGGLCRLVLNGSETVLNVSCNYAGFSSNVSSIKIHGSAFVGETAPPIFDISVPSEGGSATAQFSVNASQVADLRANKWYFNLASNNFPNGEIRGQIKLANGTYNDYDGDGRADLVVYRSSNATYYAQNSSNQSLREQNFGVSGGSSSLNADFDGDGRADFSVTRNLNGETNWFIFQSQTATLRQISWGSPSLGDFFAGGDYDGDGKFDIAVFRSGVWHILESSTGNPRYEFFGQALDVPFVNDFDKDGIWDLAITRSENGQRVWYLRKSTDGQIQRIEWGLQSDAFFVGRSDFDGDSAADILVIRNIGGQRTFFIRRSFDGQMQVIPWGLSSDLPKLADYDGDGKTDPTVNRNLNGLKLWFILQSRNQEVRLETFGLSSDL